MMVSGMRNKIGLDRLRKIKSTLYQAAVVVGARYQDDALSLQAMSLTYTTLLSLIPFLAVTFSVLKAFGVQNLIEPLLAEMLQPLGPNSAQITSKIVTFVENIRVGILGGLGLAMLFYTVVTLVANIEDAFNQIWRLPRSRGWGQRLAVYLSVVLVGPVFVFTAFALTASAQSYWLVERVTQIALVSRVFTLATRIVPFLLLCGAFTLLYKLLPYTRVPFTSALVGGVSAGLLWQVVGTAFAAFVASSSHYAAIYSSFAVMVVFLIWLYVGWLIVLLGAEVAYFHHHPRAFVREALHAGKGCHLFQEWLALGLLTEIARRHISGRPPWQPVQLAKVLGVSSVEVLADEFVRAGILLRSAEPPGIALARPPEDVAVKEIFEILAGSDVPELKDGGVIGDVLMRRAQAVDKALEGVTLRTLAAESQGRNLRLAQA
jgi:membrane protein